MVSLMCFRRWFILKERKYFELKELKKFLKRRNISYKRLSDELGISIDAVNNKLNRYTSLNICEMNQMVMLFNMKPSDISRFFVMGDRIFEKGFEKNG